VRNNRHNAFATVGSESLIDVLSNTVGGLALLCILAALDAGNLRWQLFISEEQPADTRPVMFVVERAQMRPFDVGGLTSVIENLPVGTHRLEATDPLPFEVTLEKSSPEAARLIFSSSDRFPGDALEDVFAGRGRIAEQIERLDGARQHIFIYLAPDSFDRYLDLRAHFRALGLEIGWSPFSESLVFGYGQASAAGRPLEHRIDAGR
jgi:hypothetical protein